MDIHDPTATKTTENILLKHRQGQSKDYNILLNKLTDPLLDGNELVQHLAGLKSCILLLDKHCESLVNVLLKVSWLSYDAHVVKEYQSLVVNLVSAHTLYLKATLTMIVKHFFPKTKPGDGEVVSEVTRCEDEVRFRHQHALLKTIAHIIPMTPTVLMPLLVELFPFMLKHAYTQSCYVMNLLQVSAYLPQHRQTILQLILDRMTKIDVRCPRDDITEAEDNADSKDDMFQMDEVEMELCERSSQCSRDSEGPEPPMAHSEAHRLDVLMDIMLTYTHNVCHPQGQLDWEATKQLYRELLISFDRILMPTHASCHVQFIIFYICSFKEALSESFIDYLWKKVRDPNLDSVFRQTAVAYMTSFIARANYISLSLVNATLVQMCGWAHAYMEQAAYTSAITDPRHHRPFYAVCQAIFYSIAFRHAQLLASPKGFAFIKTLNLQAIVTCRLNPLKWCQALVATTFSSIARMHQVAFCDTILERNKRLQLPTAGHTGDGADDDVKNPLDAFFPFDPYLLSRSGKYIVPLYQEYEGTVHTDDRPGEIEEEELYSVECDSAGGADTDKYILACSPPAHDFLHYGVSPGFKGLHAS